LNSKQNSKTELKIENKKTEKKKRENLPGSPGRVARRAAQHHGPSTSPTTAHTPSLKYQREGDRPHPLLRHGGQHDNVLCFSLSLASSPRPTV
jgi:hypothetical protein